MARNMIYLKPTWDPKSIPKPMIIRFCIAKDSPEMALCWSEITKHSLVIMTEINVRGGPPLTLIFKVPKTALGCSRGPSRPETGLFAGRFGARKNVQTPSIFCAIFNTVFDASALTFGTGTGEQNGVRNQWKTNPKWDCVLTPCKNRPWLARGRKIMQKQYEVNIFR